MLFFGVGQEEVVTTWFYHIVRSPRNHWNIMIFIILVDAPEAPVISNHGVIFLE